MVSWVLDGNRKRQCILVILIVVTVFARVLPLEMQKRVINEAINLGKIDLLMLYCSIYVVSVLTAGGLKFVINLLQATIAQHTLAAMRKALYHHIITLPFGFFSKSRPGEVVNALLSELAAAGEFAGMAIAVPLISILTLLTFVGYLFWLNPLLALISLGIYPMVMTLLPYLQKRANLANRQRVDASRILSDRIVETISGIHEIHGNSGYTIENRKFDRFVDRLLEIRKRWNFYRYGIKAANNFFTNLSPFLVFSVGGYLVIRGQLELGALVAFLSAQEKLYDPWKELIEFYQVYQDGAVRYTRAMEQFEVMPQHAIEPARRHPYPLSGDIEVENLSFETEDGHRLLEDISFSLAEGEQMAVVGFSGSGKSTLILCIAQMNRYTGGHLRIGGREVSRLTKMDMARNIGFVSQTPFIFSGSIEENLRYSYEADIAAGMNPAEVCQACLPELDDMIVVLQQTGLFVDVLHFGLNTVLTDRQDRHMMACLIQVRERFRHQFREELLDDVEFYHDQDYSYGSSIAENLVFGTAVHPDFRHDRLYRNDYIVRFLAQAELYRPLLELGKALMHEVVDILGNLPEDAIFFENSPIYPEELETWKRLDRLCKKKRLEQLDAGARRHLLKLALRFSPDQHKMMVMPPGLVDLILKARKRFRERIHRDYPRAVTFLNRSHYIVSQTILNNILFGRIKSVRSHAEENVTRRIVRLLIEEGLLEQMIQLGLRYPVGSQGSRLSGGQRQKLAIARVLLKAPKILIMDEATSALDNQSQARIQHLLGTHWRGRSTVISVVHRLDTVKQYDRVAVMKAGRIIETGTYDDLMNTRGVLYELVTAGS